MGLLHFTMIRNRDAERGDNGVKMAHSVGARGTLDVDGWFRLIV